MMANMKGRWRLKQLCCLFSSCSATAAAVEAVTATVDVDDHVVLKVAIFVGFAHAGITDGGFLGPS